MSIDIKAEVKISRFAAGEYTVKLRDADETLIGSVRSTPSGWNAYDLENRPHGGNGTTREMAAAHVLKAYELANGLRDPEDRRVTKELETNLWCVADHSGRRISSRWTDKAAAIAKLASLQPLDFEQIGRQAALNDEPAAPSVNADVRYALAGRPVGDPENIRIMEAFSKGYQAVRDEQAAEVLAAPATDADGNPCWNVWVTGDQSSPHTFHTHADAVTFANRKSDDGMKVHTDFDVSRADLVPPVTITDRDIREQVVEPLLGEFAADYDTDAIMADLFARWPLSEWTYADLQYNHPDFDSDAFVEVLQRHDLTDERPDETPYAGEVARLIESRTRRLLAGSDAKLAALEAQSRKTAGDRDEIMRESIRNSAFREALGQDEVTSS